MGEIFEGRGKVMLKTTEKVNEIIKNYSKDDASLVHDTIDMLCSKGIAKGSFQDMGVLVDIVEILSAFEKDIKGLEI